MNNLYISIVKNIICNKESQKKILDVGCGNGDMVQEFINNKHIAYGIDVEFKPGKYTSQLEANNLIRKIKTDSGDRAGVLSNNSTYQWPIENDSMDVVCSRAVIEHVVNLDEFAQENNRVLKSNGICIHYFPSKFSLIEPHVGIPFGAILHFKMWFVICCYSGLCFKKFRKNPMEAYEYIGSSTEYRNIHEILKIFNNQNLILDKDMTHKIMAFSSNNLFKTLSRLSFMVMIFGFLRSKCLVFKKQI